MKEIQFITRNVMGEKIILAPTIIDSLKELFFSIACVSKMKYRYQDCKKEFNIDEQKNIYYRYRYRCW